MILGGDNFYHRYVPVITTDSLKHFLNPFSLIKSLKYSESRKQHRKILSSKDFSGNLIEKVPKSDCINLSRFAQQIVYIIGIYNTQSADNRLSHRSKISSCVFDSKLNKNNIFNFDRSTARNSFLWSARQLCGGQVQ